LKRFDKEYAVKSIWLLTAVLIIGQLTEMQARYQTTGSLNPLQSASRGKNPSPTSGFGFAPVVTYDSAGDETYSVAVGDINADGNPDLVVGNQCADSNCAGSTLAVFLGNGDGTFKPPMTYPTGGYDATSVVIVDVNGDNKPDLVVSNLCAAYGGCLQGGSVSILLGKGDGTFQSAMSYTSGATDTNSVAVGDLNGDGKPDLVLASYCIQSGCVNGVISVLLGNGDGTFQSPALFASDGTYAFSIALGDLNGDGKLDVAVANLSDNSGTKGSAAVLLGNGDGTLKTAVTYDSGGYQSLSIAVADVNSDGIPDLVIGNSCVNDNNCNSGIVGILLGNGNGTFQNATAYGSGGDAEGLVLNSVAVGDVNGDGWLDVVMSNQDNGNNSNVGILLGNGDGTFQTATNYSSGGHYDTAVALSDVNRDGKLDLIVTNRCENSGTNCGATGSGSVGILINVSLKATATTLVSSPNPSSFGQVVTFTATVTPHLGGTPTGTVTFFNGSTSLGTSNLNGNGVATFQTSTLPVGAQSISATYNGDANFAPSTSQPLSQIVQGAIAVVSPSSLNFGNQTVGFVSAPQSVMLENSGNIDLTVSIAINGNNAGDYAQTNNCPPSLMPSRSCSVRVSFSPAAAGNRSAVLTFTDNAPNSPEAVSLGGVGVLPAVVLSSAELTFPTQVVYSNSKAQDVTLTNTGLGILKISAGTVSGQFGATTTCTPLLEPGHSCAISITFKPRSKGTLNGKVSVTDNAQDSPQDVSLTGTGTYVLLNPTSLNFGTQPINTTSLPKYITFSNKGSGAVNFNGNGISIVGADVGDFAETNDCGTSVPSGGSCRIKVTFTPLAEGKRTASVSFNDDGGGNPQAVTLSGIGTP
jgi:Bacterial Ig-like domain (group 3)/FG-GAP-like repeat